MITGWAELFKNMFSKSEDQKREFVSVDARYEMKTDQRSYEMLSRETSAVVTPVSPGKIHSPEAGRRTPDYFGQTARYHAPARSYSSPRPPTQHSWNVQSTFAEPNMQSEHYRPNRYEDMNPLGMNRI
jgi:hypothetical protein